MDGTNEDPSLRSIPHEGLSVTLAPAPFARRLFAYVIDLAIISTALNVLAFLVAVPAVVAAIAAFAVTRSEPTAAAFGILIFFTLLAVLALLDLYFILCEYKKGTTLGKRLFGLRVISLTGTKLSFGQCVLRDLLRWVDCMFVLPGLLSIVLTTKHQRLGDLAAGTLVVYSPLEEKRAQYLYLPQESYQYLVSVLHPQSVPPTIAREFLEYAFARFIRRDPSAAQQQEDPYYRTAKSYLAQGDEQQFSCEQILLFFAEHCRQQLQTESAQ